MSCYANIFYEEIMRHKKCRKYENAERERERKSRDVNESLTFALTSRGHHMKNSYIQFRNTETQLAVDYQKIQLVRLKKCWFIG